MICKALDIHFCASCLSLLMQLTNHVRPSERPLFSSSNAEIAEHAWMFHSLSLISYKSRLSITSSASSAVLMSYLLAYTSMGTLAKDCSAQIVVISSLTSFSLSSSLESTTKIIPSVFS